MRLYKRYYVSKNQSSFLSFGENQRLDEEKLKTLT